MNDKNLDLYWRFVSERRLMQLRRDNGVMPPWTNDRILSDNRFTSVYRVEDRVSQYVVRNVLYNRDWSAEDIVFRTILFRVFNLPATWDFLVAKFGEPTWENFQWDTWADAIVARRLSGNTVFNGAYLVAGVHTYSEYGKEHNWLYLLDLMMRDGVARTLLHASTYAHAFDVLRSYNMVGNFLAMQWLTDLNYSPILTFSENDWVQPGHGAVRGLTKLGLPGTIQGVRWLREHFREEMDKRDLRFDPISGRRWPSLMDVQNTLCEVDKYLRVAAPESGVGPARIKQRFNALEAWTHRLPIAPYHYPPKWAYEEN